MDYNVVIYLSSVDKVRIYFGNTSSTDFLNIIAPYIRKQVADGQLFTIAQDPNGRCFRYVIKDGREYISNDQGLLLLPTSRSLGDIIMNKLKDNPITQGYRDFQKNISEPFEQISQ